MNSLQKLRSSFGQGIVALLWANVVLIALAAYWIGHVSALAATISAAMIAISATLTWWNDGTGPATRIVTSMALAAEVALLVYAYSGHPYQIDMHMYFFATLAVCAGWCDWRAIVAFSAVAAVHHLLLNFVVPAAIFPDGTDFFRVVIHAVIVVVQSAVLVWIVFQLQQALVKSETAAAQAETARLETERAAERAQRAQREAERAAEEQRRSMEEQQKGIDEQRRRAEEQTQVVKALKLGLGKLSSGDLTFRLADDFPRAYQEIKEEFNLSITRLRETLRMLSESSREVSNASTEISASTTDLSLRAEEQAVSLEKTSASLEHMSTVVKENAANAQKASASAVSARDIADRNGQVVTKAVEAMGRIQESSNKISEIIGVIDEIARQTNLLALNAAVEAARAGEAGRGFAVVASEVRSLAQRSAQAAKDIKQLIAHSAEQVRDGVDLVNTAGTALVDVVTSIKAVADIVSGIAAASARQASEIEQVNAALAQIDQVTHQNSAIVEENAATAKKLEDEAKAMDKQVGFFQLKDERLSGAAASAPAAMARRPARVASAA